MENPDFWVAIATVVPVIALALAVEYRNTQWKRYSQRSLRWVALYRAILVLALAYCEYLALSTLRSQSSNALKENYALAVVGTAAMTVLVVPVAPMLLLVIIGFSRKVRTLGRDIRRERRRLRQAERRLGRIDAETKAQLKELRMDLTELLISNPQQIFSEGGSVRLDGPLREALKDLRQAEKTTKEATDEVVAEQEALRQEQRKIERRYEKAVRLHVKQALKVSGFDRRRN